MSFDDSNLSNTSATFITPNDILKALAEGDADLIDDTPPEFLSGEGKFIADWVALLNGCYGEILLDSSNRYQHALLMSPTPEEFFTYVTETSGFGKYAAICMKMLNEEDYKPLVWDMVRVHFGSDLYAPYTPEPETAPDPNSTATQKSQETQGPA